MIAIESELIECPHGPSSPPTAERTPMVNLDTGLFGGSLISAGAGLFADVVSAPPQVTWAFVVLSGIGFCTLAARLLAAYGMRHLDLQFARLETSKIRGENDGLKAQLATYQRLDVRV